mmetsp:Transcript_20038/g.63371  ORF Transcript_20038/g.63371 Transcript_20038/m.63371 type:complete len:266 (+) Transcript_20038:680-1477(+)
MWRARYFLFLVVTPTSLFFLLQAGAGPSCQAPAQSCAHDYAAAGSRCRARAPASARRGGPARPQSQRGLRLLGGRVLGDDVLAALLLGGHHGARARACRERCARRAGHHGVQPRLLVPGSPRCRSSAGQTWSDRPSPCGAHPSCAPCERARHRDRRTGRIRAHDPGLMGLRPRLLRPRHSPGGLRSPARRALQPLLPRARSIHWSCHRLQCSTGVLWGHGLARSDCALPRCGANGRWRIRQLRGAPCRHLPRCATALRGGTQWRP